MSSININNNGATTAGNHIFSCEDYKSMLLAELFSMYQTGHMTDATLTCPDGQFNVHSVILSAASSYFRALFVHERKKCLNCLICDKTFSQNLSLKRHIQSVHESKEPSMKKEPITFIFSEDIHS